MHTESGRAIASAIAYAGAHDGGLAIFDGVGVPDEDDADELAELLGEHTRALGLTAADAIGEALAIGIMAGRQLERACVLCEDAAALRAEAKQARLHARTSIRRC